MSWRPPWCSFSCCPLNTCMHLQNYPNVKQMEIRKMTSESYTTQTIKVSLLRLGIPSALAACYERLNCWERWLKEQRTGAARTVASCLLFFILLIMDRDESGDIAKRVWDTTRPLCSKRAFIVVFFRHQVSFYHVCLHVAIYTNWYATWLSLHSCAVK